MGLLKKLEQSMGVWGEQIVNRSPRKTTSKGRRNRQRKPKKKASSGRADEIKEAEKGKSCNKKRLVNHVKWCIDVK